MPRKIAAIIGLVTALGMVFAASFLGAFHKPAPHDVPVAVVGPAQVATQIDAELGSRLQGAFVIKSYADEQTARAALADRVVDGVLVPQKGRLVVASAGGRSGATVITQVFQAAASAQGHPLAVEDAIPLPAGDSGGVAGLFYVLALVVPGIAVAVLMAGAAPGLGLGARLAALVAAALAASVGDAWLADVVFGALPGHYAGLVAVSAGVTLTISVVVAGLHRVAGPAGVGLVGLLFIPIGLPAGGGPVGAHFIPQWYAAVGRFLPVGQAAEAVKNTTFFGGAALATPLLVLGAWTLLGLVLLVVPRKNQATERPSGRIRGGDRRAGLVG